ncbi:FadR family transcriptional regulator [Oceanispirochaeta crateris]|uniref:FadR family transcriptional regulator n=1 Tax=Oceanispirochaeta crateris TaxID=2518645 RepID=A0A5C1QPB2_9SPIO|nr:FadR/GntR family transcriptional regulator [Oceanispirochaeta crateris]QEN09178.1 FadR family transcriptional regulator [Oceanispirochaeta crateris]
MPTFEPLKVIKQKKISDQVYDQLLMHIKNDTWREGEKLPSENELKNQFCVSRISIRQAIQKLTALGIVETRQGEGTFLKKVTSDNYTNMLFPAFMINKNTLTEILEYRSIMEVGALELACDRITEEEITSLERIVSRMEKNSHDDKKFASDDLAFHNVIARASKNDLIINVSVFVFELMAESMEHIVTTLGMKDGKHFHRLILEKIKQQDKEGAVRAMREHVANTVVRMG